jgi:pantoate--beta-alanine ligase
VIRDLVAGLAFDVELTFCETTREGDGLALSSRNVYLNAEDRATAKYLRQTLLTAATRTLRGGLVDALLESSIAELASYGFKVDYFAFVDLETLVPLNDASQPGAFIAAARLGSTRLIDNVRLDETTLQAILAIL